MRGKSSFVLGIILTFLGLILILRQTNILDYYFLRSYGLFFLGILLFYHGISSTPKKRVYLSTVITLFGLYYVLGELSLIYPSHRLNIPVFTIIFALSFYPLFFLVKRNWDILLAGNFLLLLGMIFLFWHLEFIPHYLFIDYFNNFWPVLIICFGVILLIRGLRK